MKLAALLAQLNEIDLAVDASRARLAEIAQGLKEPAELPRARKALAAAQSEQARRQAALVERELAQQGIADHLAQAEKVLYSGATTNARELEAAEKDVQQLRRQLAHADDELLEAMLEAEAAATETALRADEAARMNGEWDAQRKALTAELPQVKALLAEEQANQAAQRGQIREDVLVTYDSLRHRKGGRAVARLDGEGCGACGVAVSQSKREQLREADELLYCGNCGRILWEG